MRVRLACLLFMAVMLGVVYDRALAEGDWQTFNPAHSPSARLGHSLVTLPSGKILVFGGEDDQERVYNDMAIFEDDDWLPLAPANTPPAPRRNHGAWVRDGKVYVHGGVGASHRLFDDLWSYDPANREWAEVHTGGSEKPGPRYGHSATPLADGSVLILGGSDAQGSFLQDLWRLNPDNTYTALASPPNFFASQVAQMVDGVLYVFGMPNEVAKYTSADDTWWSGAGGPPIGAGATSAVTKSDAGETLILVFGGLDQDGLESDVVYEYNTATGALAQRAERMPFPLIFSSSTTLTLQTELSSEGLQVFFFGGMSRMQLIDFTFMFRRRDEQTYF